MILWGQVAPAIKDRMQHAGDAMIGFQPLGDLPNFFRIVFASSWALREEHLEAMLQRIDAYARSLFGEEDQPAAVPD
jgi:glutamate decarboxylase